MESSVFWKRPDLISPTSLNTILFDLDGTLIKTVHSFHATDLATAAYITGQVNGLDWGQQEGKQLLQYADILAFKQAGGYNNGWDMSFLLAALSTARLREWQGTPLAARSTAEWAELAHRAQLAGRGGLRWVRETMPASALPDNQMLGQVYRELYWGGEELRKRYQEVPRYLPASPGFVHNEEMFCAPDLFARLRESGIRHMGIITGRIGPEVDIALEMLEAYCGERWWDVVIPATVMPKPDPRALKLAIDGIAGEVSAGLYIGDTGDDLGVVLNYRAIRRPADPEMLAVSLVYPHEIALYQQRGADFVIEHIQQIWQCLAELTPAPAS